MQNLDGRKKVKIVDLKELYLFKSCLGDVVEHLKIPLRLVRAPQISFCNLKEKQVIQLHLRNDLFLINCHMRYFLGSTYRLIKVGCLIL